MSSGRPGPSGVIGLARRLRLGGAAVLGTVVGTVVGKMVMIGPLVVGGASVVGGDVVAGAPFDTTRVTVSPLSRRVPASGSVRITRPEPTVALCSTLVRVRKPD